MRAPRTTISIGILGAMGVERAVERTCNKIACSACNNREGPYVSGHLDPVLFGWRFMYNIAQHVQVVFPTAIETCNRFMNYIQVGQWSHVPWL